jgi:valyl-tRNA synthetase
MTSRSHYGLTAADAEFVAAKQSLVLAGRKLRSDYNIASNKRVHFILAQPSDRLAESELKVLQQLLNATSLETPKEFAAPQGTPSSVTPLGVLYMPLEGLIDKAAETGAARQGDREDARRAGDGAAEIV